MTPKENIDDQLVESFFKISRLMKDLDKYNSKIAQLTILQFETLILLKKKPKTQMREIANYFQIKMPTATALLDRLIKMDLVKRKGSTKDRRVVELSLTSKGNFTLQDSLKYHRKKIHGLLSYLSKLDKKELLRIINKITEKVVKSTQEKGNYKNA